MALFDDIFGGKQESQQVADTTPRQLKALLDPFQHSFERLFGVRKGDPLAGIPQSPQSQSGFAAPLAAAEARSLADIEAQAGNASRRSLISDTLGGRFTEAGNPFTEAAIRAAQRPTLQAAEDLLSRTLPGQFTAGGHSVQPGGSSPFDMAAARAFEATTNTLGDIASRIAFESHEAERGRQQQAITFSQQEVDTSIKNLQAQELPRLIQQYGIDKGLEEFQTRTQSLIQLLGLLSGGTLNQTQVIGESRSTPGALAPIAGGVGAFAAGSGGSGG